MENLLHIPVHVIDITSVVGGKDCEVHAIDSRMNPSGSHKDWPVARMLCEAVRKGIRHVVDYTTGREGIAVGTLAPMRATIVMPEGITAERETLIRATGAELILTSHQDWVRGAVEAAMQIRDDGTFLLNQSVNPDNPLAFRDVFIEAMAQFEQPFDYAVVCAGTGATAIGAGMAGLKVIAVDPTKSPSTWAFKNGVSFEHHPHKSWSTGAGSASPIAESL